MVNFTRATFVGTNALWQYPKWTHPFVAPFKKEILAIRQSQKRAKDLLIPMLNERKERLEKDPGWEPPSDFITWCVQSADKSEWNPEKLASTQMGVGKYKSPKLISTALTPPRSCIGAHNVSSSIEVF
jgi:hypothetical protein